MNDQIQDILVLNRNPNLSTWFLDRLKTLVKNKEYDVKHIPVIKKALIEELIAYRKQHNIHNVIIGMSGGVDSATTAALFKEAGYDVFGILLPIHQNIEETERGVEACKSLEIKHLIIDLSVFYETVLAASSMMYDEYLIKGVRHADALRRGNIRARSRMMTLYNFAALEGGFVASTDNYSELAAGFWTLHGDVGDVAPIQSLTKSWEVPMLARSLGVPESIVKAVPTDGLGIANGDEDQFGFSYLHFDIVLLLMTKYGYSVNDLLDTVTSKEDVEVLTKIFNRIKGSTFKRRNPYNLIHPVHSSRFDDLAKLDDRLFNFNSEE